MLINKFTMKQGIYIFIPIFAFLLIACKQKPKSKEDGINSDIVNNPNSANSKDSNKNVPIFKFNEESFSFGTIKEGAKVHHTFKFKNVGNADLVISNAHGSCGCTIPAYSSKPVPPGGDGEIEVSFNSSGKGGVQDKTVTIIANTIPNSHTIHIMGEVAENN